MEYLLAFFVAMGIAIFLWCLLGILLIPVFDREMVTLCYVSGDGNQLEQRVRGYGWLRESRLTGGRLIIVDQGLSEKGITLAHKLSQRYEWVSCLDGDLPEELLP